MRAPRVPSGAQQPQRQLLSRLRSLRPCSITPQLRASTSSRRPRLKAAPSGFQSKPAQQVDQQAAGQSRASAQHIEEYRRSTGICLVNRQGLVFAARRIDDTQGTWQMPQGGIDYLENPMVAAVRELREETGVQSARIVAAKDDWLTYDCSTCVRSQFTGSWVRYKGQTQKWFLMTFYGKESEIDLEQHGEREFLDYTWLPVEQMPSQVVSFKRGVYEEVAREFGPIISRMKESWQSQPT